MGVYLDDEQVDKLAILLEDFQKFLDAIRSGDFVYQGEKDP